MSSHNFIMVLWFGSGESSLQFLVLLHSPSVSSSSSSGSSSDKLMRWGSLRCVENGDLEPILMARRGGWRMEWVIITKCRLVLLIIFPFPIFPFWMMMRRESSAWNEMRNPSSKEGGRIRRKDWLDVRTSVKNSSFPFLLFLRVWVWDPERRESLNGMKRKMQKIRRLGLVDAMRMMMGGEEDPERKEIENIIKIRFIPT